MTKDSLDTNRNWFKATNDENGRTVKIFIRKDESRTAGSRAGIYHLEGRKYLETEQGDHVNIRAKGIYEVMFRTHEEIFRSDDPIAPGKDD